jgi:hypothetical protein
MGTKGEKMKRGDRVMIYEDPITKQHPEGPAVLIKKLNREYWKVALINEPDRTYERKVVE